ncbi:hypothetical protein Tco_0374437 [Tanacetum coccineum]
MYESRGCLLLLGKDYAHSRRLNIYEMRNGYPKWSVKYVVNLDDIMRLFPKTWRIPSRVWCIVLGEREEDSIMIVDLLSKVVQYNPVLKTVRTLSDLESMGGPLREQNMETYPDLATFINARGERRNRGEYARGREQQRASRKKSLKSK